MFLSIIFQIQWDGDKWTDNWLSLVGIPRIDISIIDPFFLRALQFLQYQMSGKQIVKTIQCPFVAAHVMPYERFLNHLEKCQYPDKKSFRKCKFNPYHVIHMAEINNHENKCPDKKKYEEEDDDWGMEDIPAKQEIEVNEPSQISYSTSMTGSMSSKYTSSNDSYEFSVKEMQQRSNKSKKGEGKKGEGKKGEGKKAEKEKKAINNTWMQAQDLDDFNPQG